MHVPFQTVPEIFSRLAWTSLNLHLIETLQVSFVVLLIFYFFLVLTGSCLGLLVAIAWDLYPIKESLSMDSSVFFVPVFSSYFPPSYGFKVSLLSASTPLR